MAQSRRFRTLAEKLFVVSPRAGLWAAERRGLHYYRRSKRRREKHIPPLEDFAEVFGVSDPAALDALAREFSVWQAKIDFLRDAASRGELPRIARLVEWEHRERLAGLVGSGKALILTTWHAGPSMGIWAGLASMGIAMLKVQNVRWQRAPEGWEILETGRGPAGQAPAILKKCLARLRSGGIVAMTADVIGEDPSHPRVSFLGRQTPTPRGVAVLAQMSGAPILPLAARWDASGRRIVVEVQEAIEAKTAGGESASEAEMRVVRELSARREAYIRRYPASVNRWWIEFMKRQPRDEG